MFLYTLFSVYSMWSLRRSVVVFSKERKLETSVLHGFSLTSYGWTSDFIGQIFGRYEQPLLPFHENAKPDIFLMITVRCIETQSICETLSTLKKRFVKKQIYGHCLFKDVNGSIEFLCMGICGRCFRRAFSIRSSAFQRNRRKSKIVLLVASSNYQNHADGNKKIIGSLSNGDSVGNENARISKTTTLHVNHAFCTFLYRRCMTTTWTCVLSRKVWKRSNFSANNFQHFFCSVIAET